MSFPELGNNCCRNWQPVIAIGRRVDCSHKGRTAIASGGSPETEVSHQKPAMFETRLYSTCIIGIEARIVTELISKIIDHSCGRLLVIPQEPPRLAHYAELNREAQLVFCGRRRSWHSNRSVGSSV